jgi:hypothetical protein
MQGAVSAMNTAFSAEGLRSASYEPFHVDSGASLSEALGGLPGVDLPEAVARFIDSWPSGLQAAVRAVVHHNFTRDATVPITFAWKPGYDYAVEIFDVHDTKTSTGGITVILTSRYPADAHPLTME